VSKRLLATSKATGPIPLGNLFQQRVIGPTYGSVASRLPLRTPSGAQYTESQLETDLLIQIAFSIRVADVITQPIIHYRKGNKARQYTPDILFETLPDLNEDGRLYLIEVKPLEHLATFKAESEDKIAAAHIWCARHGGDYYILTEREIRTDYLTNARMLSRFVGQEPDPVICRVLSKICCDKPTIAEAIAMLGMEGFPEHLARHAIEQAIANRLIGCNLDVAITDTTVLSPISEPELNSEDFFLRRFRRR
jgi:hypothetical protein